jgi:hypothetical protein
MHQIKIFKGVEGALRELETDINEWLASFKGEVINIAGNIAPQSNSTGESLGLGKGFAPSDVIVIVHYKT